MEFPDLVVEFVHDGIESTGLQRDREREDEIDTLAGAEARKGAATEHVQDRCRKHKVAPMKIIKKTPMSLMTPTTIVINLHMDLKTGKKKN